MIIMMVDIVLPSPVAARSNWLFLHSCNQRYILVKDVNFSKRQLKCVHQAKALPSQLQSKELLQDGGPLGGAEKSNLDIVQITLDPQSQLSILQKISNSRKNWQQFAFQNLETTIIVLLIKHFWLKSSRNFCRQNSAKF